MDWEFLGPFAQESELVSNCAWLQDQVKFDLRYCLGVEGVELASRMSSSVSVDFVIGRLHISQILQIALIHIILLDSCIFWALKVLSGQAACLVLTKGSGRESQVLGCKAERSNRDLMLCSAWAAAQPSGNNYWRFFHKSSTPCVRPCRIPFDTCYLQKW